MICVQLILFPEASVAVHVLEITSVKPHPGAELSLKLMAGFGSQLSEAVAIPVLAGDVSLPHSTETSAGQLTAGAIPSVPAATTTGLFTQVSLQDASAVSSILTVYEFAGKFVKTPFPTCTIGGPGGEVGVIVN
jgi:hypothetical protein